jgi:predicted RNA-binding protein with RPS1 domain
MLKKETQTITHNVRQQEIESQQMLRSSKALIDFVKISELYRKGFSEKLREALSLNDDLKNQIFELDQNKKLTLISYEIIQKKLHMLYESMTEISNAKNLEDKF